MDEPPPLAPLSMGFQWASVPNLSHGPGEDSPPARAARPQARTQAPRPAARGAPFQCSHCGKVLSNRTSLNVHVRSHTGERPYRCSVCPAAFTDLSNWRRHRVVHTKAKLYHCDICQSRFSQSGSLRMHVRKRHPEHC